MRLTPELEAKMREHPGGTWIDILLGEIDALREASILARDALRHFNSELSRDATDAINKLVPKR